MFEYRADGGKFKLEFHRFWKFKLRDLPMHSLLFRGLGFATPDPQKGHKIHLSKPKLVSTKFFCLIVCLFLLLCFSRWIYLGCVTFCCLLMKEISFHQECMIILHNFSFELYYMEIVFVT